MLSNKEIICPNNLLDVAHSKKGVKVAIVNAGKPLPMLSAQDAVNENLIEPVFIGDDVTDEYGFKSVNNLGGYSIKVGYQSNTLANFFIKDTKSVLKFLNFVSFCSKKIRCQSLKLNQLYRGLN